MSRDCGETWISKQHLIDDPTLQISNPACLITSPMDDPDPPGVWGTNQMSLEALIVDIDWLYR